MSALVELQKTMVSVLDGAILTWADHTTDPTSPRRDDLLRDKVRTVSDFFSWCGKPIEAVTLAT